MASNDDEILLESPPINESESLPATLAKPWSICDEPEMPVDLWDECVVSSATTIPSTDQQDYAHDLGLISVSGENNARSETQALRSNRTLHITVQTIDKMRFRISRYIQDAFCGCYNKAGKKMKSTVKCVCGEDDKDFDWVWDPEVKSWASQLQDDNREVHFHKHYSSGTAAIRGNQALISGQHYWEIKMISPVYGTDMMVGVGTAEANLNSNSTKFCSFLGSDAETWGLSYTGVFHHNGKCESYSQKFGQGSIIGVHLDTWNGTLAFFKNRKPLGIACRGLKGKKLYPMVSSTAAKSAMKMICARSFNSSLQYFCCLALRKMVNSEYGVLESLNIPPGLSTFLRNTLGWLLAPVTSYEYPKDKHSSPSSSSAKVRPSLFALDKSKMAEENSGGDSAQQQPSTSNGAAPLVLTRQPPLPSLCYRYGSCVSKRRRYVCDKQKLFISLLDLSSSEDDDDDESLDEENELVSKRKH